MRHGANKALEAAAEESKRNYRLTKWKARVGQFADNDQIKSLREEIGIMRLLLEETLNKCEDSVDLMLYSHKMSEFVMKIEKLVVSCDKLENRMGLMLNKSTIINLAQQYVTIINEHVKDPEIIEQISMKMVERTLAIENPLE